MAKTVWKNEKIIHTRAMRDFLISHGGVLKKTKTDLRDKGREIYIFKLDTVSGVMGEYQHKDNGGLSNGD